MNIIDNRQIIIKDNYDVIVVGGGIAGVSAAVAASREGAKALLIEKSIVLGGLATAGLISWYEPLCDSQGKKMIGGISEELIQLSIKYGFDDMPEVWRNGDNTKLTNKRYTTHYSPTIVVTLSEEELRKYTEYSFELAKEMAKGKTDKKTGKKKPTKYAEIIAQKRSRLVAGAIEKITKLYGIIQDYVDDTHMLVYCGATKLLVYHCFSQHFTIILQISKKMLQYIC